MCESFFNAEARRGSERKERIFRTLMKLMPNNKYGPFDNVGITKVIKRIRLLDRSQAAAEMEEVEAGQEMESESQRAN